MEPTRNFWVFCGFALIATNLFYLALAETIANQLWLELVIAALLYPASMFVVGFTLGYSDYKKGERRNADFLYHLATYIVVVGSWGIWSLFGWYPQSDPLYNALGYAGWALGLLIHYFFARRTLRGYDPEEIFE
ncbi:MAG: hypothetical protein CL946_06510 [Ectothiorhodospiraceae bacterium]|nr:hypothetical protein [Ectothiorhodospiraceae bacterium]